tara:strand:- start:21358 stop:22575 length:1218 start_codon:yes stop_codon:yes gene_type:complete
MTYRHLAISKELLLILASTIFLLQSFRIFTIYYLILATVLGILIFAIFKHKYLFKSTNITDFFYWLFLIFLFYTSVISFIHLPPDNVAVGISRMWFMPLVVIFFYGLVTEEKNIEKLVYIFLFVILLASGSLYYQLFFGQISFLQESHLRSGVQRYYTILGSVTVFGQVIGVGLFLCLVLKMRKIFKILLTLTLLVAALISLSKSAVMNIIIAIVFASFYFRKFRILIYLLLLFVILCFFVIIFENSIISQYINAMLFTAFRINLLDNLVPLGSPPVTSDQILSRLLGRFDIWGKSTLEFIFGIGVKGGAGALGVQGATSHNQYIDLWQMGGFGLVISFICLQLSTLFKLLTIRTELSKTLLYANIMVMVNFIMQNGGLFQPVTSFIFWISVTFVIFYSNKKETA